MKQSANILEKPTEQVHYRWPLIYGAVLVWLVLLIILMRIFTNIYA
ncbi:MAG: hypothetical protein ACK5NG_04900 [Chthoniobacterales bacterium]